jgi:CheY-like chemotaxis protein
MKIYLVDDDDLFNYLNEAVIRRVAPEVEISTFKSGEGVLNSILAMGSDSEVPDVMLLDIRMPDMDGFELLKALGALQVNPIARTKIYMLSSSLDDRDLDKANDNPLVTAFLSKPLTIEKFTEIYHLFNPPISL